MTFKIKFGTDGWRGKIANEYTFDNVRRCAQGFSGYLQNDYPEEWPSFFEETTTWYRRHKDSILSILRAGMDLDSNEATRTLFKKRGLIKG